MKISEVAIRDFLRESLFGHSEPGTINVNSVVDPSAAVTDPMNTRFKPQSDVELKIALNNLVDSSNLQPSEIFDAIKDKLSSEEEKMGNPDQSNTKLESAIRQTIRKLLSEITLDQIPRFQQQAYLDAGAPAKGPIPQDIIDAVNAKIYKSEKRPSPIPAARQQASKKPQTDRAERLKSDKAFLQSKFSTLELDKDVGIDDVKSLAVKIDQSVDVLRDAVIKAIGDDFKRVVNDYNKTLKGDQRFSLRDGLTDLDRLVDQYVKFLSHVEGSSSEADWPVIKGELEKLHTKFMDPSYYVLYSGDKFSSDIKVVGQSLRLWLIETGKKIKELEGLRGSGSTSGRININRETMLAPLKRYLERLGLGRDQIDELMQALADASADESNANMTNILSQKIVIAAFTTKWENEVLDYEAVDGMKLRDLFPEKPTSRASTFARAASGYAGGSSKGQVRSGVRSTDDVISRLISYASDILRAGHEMKEMPQMSAELSKKMKGGEFTKAELDAVVDVLFDDTGIDVVERLTQPGMNKSYDESGYGSDSVYELITNAIDDFGTVMSVSGR